jgi:hypothetical protein
MLVKYPDTLVRVPVILKRDTRTGMAFRHTKKYDHSLDQDHDTEPDPFPESGSRYATLTRTNFCNLPGSYSRISQRYRYR